jgi:hypothetical protein
MAGQHPRHDCNQAQAEGVIRFHGRQARRQHRPRHLATLRTGNRSAANPAPPRAHREKSAPHKGSIARRAQRCDRWRNKTCAVIVSPSHGGQSTLRALSSRRRACH